MRTETSATTQAEYYRETIEAGLHELFEQRVAICPMCGGSDLVREQTLRDLVMLKPGFFHMSRCQSCGHLFQNPRLNARGLEFYYRDFYTGAGEETIKSHLALMTGSYLARARMVEGHSEPRRWLDVGAGYGHFSQAARELWTETKFHVLDISASIKRAEDLGWAERAYVGRFSISRLSWKRLTMWSACFTILNTRRIRSRNSARSQQLSNRKDS